MSFSRPKPRLLFLYSELADYFLACIRTLISVYDVEVHIIHWQVNKEAPFAFDFPVGAYFYEKEKFTKKSLREKIRQLDPDFIYCSGWMDKEYLTSVSGYKKNIPVVIGLDTKWEGTLKQRVACYLSKVTINTIFSYCWVPGNQQKKYALKLGFKAENIMMGYYSADTDYFSKLGIKATNNKKKKYPRRLIYVGRYYEFKGIKDLWKAFIEWEEKKENDWELWCLGTGDIEPIVHPKIKHFGFVQRRDMAYFLEETGIFIMPSHFEPWGVVLHEFAAAGFPLICSDAVGSAEAFLAEGENGYLYKAGNIEELMESINRITSLSNIKLLEMGSKSVNMAVKITPKMWAETLMELIDNKK